MAVTDTSEQSRSENMVDIAAMRRGKRPGKPAPKSRRKLVVISALLVLLIAGGAGWFFLMGPTEAPPEDDFVPEIIEDPTKLSYVKLDALFIPVETSGARRKRLVVYLALEIAEDGTRESKVRGILPRLHEAYLRALSDRPLPQTDDGRIEAVHIKNRVRAESMRLLGPDIVHDVIVLNVWVREG